MSEKFMSLYTFVFFVLFFTLLYTYSIWLWPIFLQKNLRNMIKFFAWGKFSFYGTISGDFRETSFKTRKYPP